jgi:hypothetical protein
MRRPFTPSPGNSITKSPAHPGKSHGTKAEVKGWFLIVTVPPGGVAAAAARMGA